MERMRDIADRLAAMPDEERAYALRTLPTHLAGAGQVDRLRQILASLGFLQAKVAALGADPLIADFDLIGHDHTGYILVQSAVRLAAHVLDRDAQQLYTQLVARLDGITAPPVPDLLAQAPATPRVRLASDSVAAAGTALLRTLAGHTDRVTSIVALPDGSGFVSGSDDATIIVRDARSGSEMRRLGHPERSRDPADGVTALALSPDGTRLCAGRRNGAIEVYDVMTGSAMGVLSKRPDTIGGLTFSPDGRTLAAATMRGNLALLDAGSGAVRHEVDVPGGTVPAVALAGDLVVFGAGSGAGVWAPETGEVHELPPDDIYVRTLETRSDGHVLVAGRDGFVRVWDVPDRRVVMEVSVSSDAALSGAAPLPDGRFVVATWDGRMEVRTAAGRLERTIGGDAGQVRALTLSSDGRLAMTGGPDGAIRVWDLLSPAVAGRRPRPPEHNQPVYRLLLQDAGAVSLAHDGTLRVWSIDDAAELLSFQLHDPVTERGGWMLAAVGPKRVIAGSSHGELVSFRLETAADMVRWQGHRVNCTAVAGLADGKRALSAGMGDGIKVWDARRAAALTTIDIEDWGMRRSRRIRQLICLADGRHAIAVFSEAPAHVFDIGSGELIGTWPRDVAFHAYLEESDELLGWRNGVWEFRASMSGEVRRTVPGPAGPPSAVSAAHGGASAASISADGMVETWSLGDGRRICGFGADAEIQACVITADGHGLVCGDRSGRMHFLEIVDGPVTATAPGPNQSPWWMFWRRGG